MSQQDLSHIRSVLKNIVSKRTGDDFTRVRAGAEKLIQTIDEVYVYGGVDFVHHIPLVARVANIMRTPKDQSPTMDQVSQLIELLKGKSQSVWSKYFKVEYIDDLLKGPESIPVAIRLAEVTDYAGFTIKALAVLESNLDKLTPETKRQALTVIVNILSRTYHVGPIDFTDKVRPYVLQVKNAIESI